MVVLAFDQMLTGKTLSPEQYLETWREAVENPKILDSEGTVINPALLSDIVLKKLGRTDIGLTFGMQKPGMDNTLIGYRITVPYQESGHRLAGDVSGKIIYNPGNTKDGTQKTQGVYVYAKN